MPETGQPANSHIKPVAYPADGLDEFRPTRIVFNRTSQPAYVDIQRPRVPNVFRLPDLAEQLLTFHHFARVLHQHNEQTAQARSKVCFAVFALHFPTF